MTMYGFLGVQVENFEKQTGFGAWQLFHHQCSLLNHQPCPIKPTRKNAPSNDVKNVPRSQMQRSRFALEYNRMYISIYDYDYICMYI